MKFNEQLNTYISQISCTAKELCALSGISQATLSRYRNCERIPESDSSAFEELCSAIAEIAAEKEIQGITAASVKQSFIECEDFISADRESLRKNFNTLITALNINLPRLCQYTNYDPSAIFRIRSGSRNPGDCEQFASGIAAFTAREMQTQPEIAAVAELIGCDTDDIRDISPRYTLLKSWLLSQSGHGAADGSISKFLNRLDEFDLNEYINIIRFNELKVPSVPFQLPSGKTYNGISEMMESELDFLKATVLSKSDESVIMYSDMPMKEMAKNEDFAKKWMFGMAMMLKKGLHLYQIHNIDRSFDEMMLGLESWIPMYMTGQISPYYFKNAQNGIFLHLLKVSGAAALSGEAIAGYHSDGRYYLTKSKRELEYYRRRAEEMLADAYPLMDIYRSERENEFNTFLLSDIKKPGARRAILSTLPLYTISPELLAGMLTRRGIDAAQQLAIIKYADACRQRILSVLETNTVTDEIPALTAEKFGKKPPVLELSGMFAQNNITYSFEEYAAHLKQTELFADTHPNYILKENSAFAFCNLQILIHEKQFVIVSKGNAPAIHFVIRHPKLRSAIENFVPPMKEE